MHIGLGMCLRLGTFSWITCAACLVLLPPFFWDEIVFNRWFKRRPQMTNVTVYYRADCSFCHTVACAVSATLLCPESRLLAVDLDAADKRSGPQGQLAQAFKASSGWLAVVDHSGTVHLGWDAVGAVCRGSPLLRPLAGLVSSAEAHGKWVHGLLQLLVHHHPPPDDDADGADPELAAGYGRRPPPEQLPPSYRRSPALKRPQHKLLLAGLRFGVFLGVQAFAVFLVYTVIALNGANIGWHPGPDWSYRPLIAMLQLDQYWGVFAPRPPDVYFWINIEATLDDGTKAELFANRAYINAGPPIVPHTWAKPKEVWYGFKNHRWIKFFENGYLSHPSFRELRGEFGKFVCRNYNNHNFGPQRLWQYKVHLFSEQANYATMDGFNRIQLGSQVLWDHVCYNKR
eukprot:TRINITY_DN941_c1_g1_i2.p2 TRINITY_DN941_c1_g1~~TRINITY_DN941_c1_g1_i2.p2  ORF type:complete len:400 (-),score=155.98 TRINITY_DN941_c1_g1_i2:38-1237(-)